MKDTTPEIIDFYTKGTCCKIMHVKILNGIITDSEFEGGCHGNLQAVKALTKGMSVDEVIEKLKGIKCGAKSTSCPDQLAKCLTEYKEKAAKTNTSAVRT